MIKIAHISDIHWRGMQRHSEYTEAFEDFFKKLEELCPDLIVVGGPRRPISLAPHSSLQPALTTMRGLLLALTKGSPPAHTESRTSAI